jgi:glycosyltransferase involved in cell wall biosynthesis
MRIVGTNHSGYANDRNIADLPFEHYRVVRCRNAFRLPNYAYFKLRGKMHPYYPFLHWDGGLANYDALHFFNGISLGKKPWLSTFETFLPRWGAYGGTRVEWGLKKLVAPACKRLIALSHCTQEIQRQYLDVWPSYQAEIMAKVSILHPPQALILPEYAPKPFDAGIRFVFVGADFFRKGGLEMLQAFDYLLQKGHPIYLDIVSTLQFGDYASQTDASHLAAAKAIIARHPNHISHQANLSNTKVLECFKRAHVGLLPTWADTYGYSVLEAMAAGCAVLTTDVRALPEINAASRGWIIPTERDSWGNAILGTEAQRRAFSQKLRDQLIAQMEEIVGNPEVIANKGANGWNYIREFHSPEKSARQLEIWYDLALKD